MNEARTDIPRRRMRRPLPVAGGLEREPFLELDFTPTHEPPLLAYGLLGFIGGAVGCAGLGVLIAAVWWRRLFG